MINTVVGPRQADYLGGMRPGGFAPAGIVNDHSFADTYTGAFWTTSQTASPSSSTLASTVSSGSHST